MKIDVRTLGLRELDALIAAAERRQRLLADRRSITVVRKELVAMAAAHGYAIDELFGETPPAAIAVKAPTAKRRSTKKVAARYRDPDDRRNTWTGRGRPPRWLAFRLAQGKPLADFLIPGLARLTQKKNAAIGRRSVFKRGEAHAASD